MEPIQFSGLPDLNEDEKQVLKEASTKYYEKIKMLLHNDLATLNVHVKTYRQKNNSDNEKKKYNVTVKTMAPTTIIFRSGTTNWMLASALNDAFDKVCTEIKNHFKIK
ncbi:MAG: hypothetical protein ABIG89_07505 [Candidatus Woesearchaeota archaeon]